MSESNIHKKAMIEALTKSLGVVTSACNKVGINRKTHYEWYNKDPEYKEAVDSIQDIAIDFVESSLHKSIASGNVTAQIFYLKTKGKQRGYKEDAVVDNSVTIKVERVDNE